MADRVESEIRVGEAASAGLAAARRWGTGGWIVVAGGVAIGAAACAVGTLIGQSVAAVARLPANEGRILGLGLGAALAVFVGLPVLRRILTIRYRRRLSQRGASGPFPVSYEITDAAFIYTIGGIAKHVQWNVVSELFRASNWWVLMAQGESYYIQSRAFGDRESERAFVSSILTRMPDSARGRSGDAVSFIGRAG